MLHFHIIFTDVIYKGVRERLIIRMSQGFFEK